MHNETLDCGAGAVKAESLPVMDINPTSHVGLHCTGTGQRTTYLEPENFCSHILNIIRVNVYCVGAAPDPNHGTRDMHAQHRPQR